MSTGVATGTGREEKMGEPSEIELGAADVERGKDG